MKSLLPIKFRAGANENQVKVKNSIKELKKIPKEIHAILSEMGCCLIYFNGKITDNFEMKKYRGVTPRGWNEKYTWDNVSSAYFSERKIIFLGMDEIYVDKMEVTLHEYVHAFDSNVGLYLFGKNLSEMEVVLEAIKKEPFSEKYFENPREYIANSFDLFYSGKKSRMNLKKNHFIIYQFLFKIDKILKEF